MTAAMRQRATICIPQHHRHHSNSPRTVELQQTFQGSRSDVGCAGSRRTGGRG